ncbi:ABC transporter permease subunit, partial [Rhizobium ruizarguesonis]
SISSEPVKKAEMKAPGKPAIMIENIFSLDGLGRLGYLSVIKRDYPIVFATLYILSLLGLVVSLVSDLIYTWIDPRID